MLHAATDLMRYRAVVDGAALPIDDLFFSPELASLAYVSVRKSPAPWAGHAIVSACDLGMPDSDLREVWVGATEREFRDAPAAVPNSALREVAQKIAGHPGEAGGTGSEDRMTGNQIEAAFERASDWIGAPATHEGAVIGRVDDFLIEWPRPRLTHMVINTGTTLPERQVVLPAECCGVPCDSDKSVRVDVDREALETAPEVEQIDALDRHWIDTVREYYRLPV